MAEEIKFTTEEMDTIKGIQSSYNDIIFQSGQLFIQRETLEQQLIDIDVKLAELKDAFKKARKSERELANALVQKYGDGELNPQTGVFTPRPRPTQ